MRPCTVGLALAALAGCSFQTYRVRPDAAGWRQSVRRVAVLPSIRIYQVSAGGVREEQQEWTAAGAQHVTAALQAGLARRGLHPKLVSTRDDAELEDVRLLYTDVGNSVWQFTYGAYPSRYKVEHFDYEVGPIGRILDRTGADALLIADGRNELATVGRKLTRLMAIHDYSLLTMGLIDRKGRLVWFDVWGGGALDLRDERDVASIVDHLLDDLAGASR